MTTFNLTCEAVETTLHEYLDESLEPWLRASVEEHLGECARCSSFARELRSIESEAAALPALLPDREIWPGIADRIGAPAIVSEPVAESTPLAPTAELVVFSSDTFLPISEPPAVASKPLVVTSDAAAPPTELPVATSDVVYPPSEPPAVTSEVESSLSESPVVASDASLSPSEAPALQRQKRPNPPEMARPRYGPVTPVSELIFPSATARAPDIEPPPAILRRREIHWGWSRIGLAAAALVLVTAGATFLLTTKWRDPVQTPSVASATTAPKLSSSKKSSAQTGNRGPVAGTKPAAPDLSTFPPVAGALAPALTVSARSEPPTAPSPENAVYDKEIGVLQRIVRRQKGGLDTSTVTVIEKNLGSLDSAIDQIRAALKKDPGSSLLDAQASRALEMKVELLRRAAMLQSNT